MRKRWYSKSVCAVLTGAMVIGSLPASSLPAYAKESADTKTSEESETTDSDNSLLTEIDFDGEEITASNGVEVKVEGTEKYSSDTRDGSGNAFDFNDSTYLDVSYENGDSLLSGHDELTIYYESKPDGGKSANWSFFAANDDSAQTYNQEQYIGALDGTNGIRAERYLSDGERAAAIDCSLSDSDWKAVAVVFDKDSYSVYADGEKLKTVESSIALTDIFEDNAVLQIGKGNWGSGEYYDGLIDNIKIYGEALSDEEIAELSYFEKEPEVEKTAAEKLAEDLENLSIHDADDVRGNIYLPLTADNGSEISWKSSDSSVITDKEEDGKAAGVVSRGDEDKKITLTASLSLEGETAEKEIEVTVKAKSDADKDYSAGYLWAYFSAYNGYERMFLGYSEDGLNWESLNKDEDGTPQPILSNDGEGSDLGVRDPHIIRSPEGDRYWIIGTDLHAEGGGSGGSGWDQTSASQKIVVWESTDLTDWSDAELVFAGMDTAGCVWAPEAIYDEEKGDYLVYWSARDTDLVDTDENALRVYYTRTRDFHNFEEPQVWLSEDTAKDEINIIDSTIAVDNGKYYRFSTSDWFTVLDCSDSLATDLFDVNIDKDKSVEGNWTRLIHRDEYATAGFDKREGFTVYQLPDGRWCAMGDNGGYVPFVTDDLSSASFTMLDSNEYSFEYRFRHGTVMRLSSAEEEKVLDFYKQEESSDSDEDSIPEKSVIADFDFDNEENGFSSEYSKAKGNVTLDESWDGSKAAYFDGTDDFLSVESVSENILKGAKELTISYENKVDKSGTGWVAYASNSSAAPTYQSEQYLGILTNSSSTTVERYKNSGSRPASASASTDTDWAHIDIVLSSDSTKIYVNGELADEESSEISLSSIFGSSPILQIGKANWGSGEYYQGWIDNFRISNWAFSEEEVKASAAAFVDTLPMVSDVTIGSAPDRTTALTYRGSDDHTAILTDLDYDTNTITSYVRNDQDLTKCPLTIDFTADEESIRVNGESFENGKNIDLSNDVKIVIGEDDDKESWTVKKPVLCNNTVLNGQFADPDIDYFDGKFWIFPTTDGYSGWSGYQFHAFSSENLVDWKDEGIIMDLKADESYENENGVAVATSDWAVGSAWAPTIEEKDGKYYFYYCGKNTSGTSCIGVAVADNPAGPYKDSGEALLTVSLCNEYGVSMGQAIDPSVFTDEDGSSYITFGNGKAAIAKLSDDMMGVESITQITGLTDFRESVVVVKANGKYHWTWSCDDANSENYHVNYAVTDSLYNDDGSCSVSDVTKNFLYKNTDLKILGCAHQSMVNATDADGVEHWYMAYHRFYTPTGIFTSSDGLGVHRETCVDEISFDEDGKMQITPTLEGVDEFKHKSDEKTESGNKVPEGTTSENDPSGETPSDEKPSDEKPAEETPSGETPSEETPSEETPSEGQPSEETPSDDGGDVKDDEKTVSGDETAADSDKSETAVSEDNIPKSPADGVLSTDGTNLLLSKNKYYINPGFKVKKYQVSDKKTVKVSRKGKVTVKKAGSATITAIGKSGESAVYSIVAEKPKMKKLKVTAAGTYDIKEMLSGVSYTSFDSISSSKTSVAEVSSDGKITVKAKGSTVISVVIGGKKYKARLKAKI